MNCAAIAIFAAFIAVVHAEKVQIVCPNNAIVEHDDEELAYCARHTKAHWIDIVELFECKQEYVEGSVDEVDFQLKLFVICYLHQKGGLKDGSFIDDFAGHIFGISDTSIKKATESCNKIEVISKIDTAYKKVTCYLQF